MSKGTCVAVLQCFQNVIENDFISQKRVYDFLFHFASQLRACRRHDIGSDICDLPNDVVFQSLLYAPQFSRV
jgi:hypothetical protein